MKKIISFIIVILVIGGIFAACNNTNNKNTENTNSTVITNETSDFSKFDEIKTAITADFVSDEAQKIYNIIISSNTVSGSDYELICEFLSDSKSNLDELNPSTRVFQITSNCNLELNGRVLWLTVNTGDGIKRVCIINNIDVFNISDNGKLMPLRDFSIYKGTIYQYGKSLCHLYDTEDYTLINPNNSDYHVFQYGNVLTLVEGKIEDNGLINKISEDIISEDCINKTTFKSSNDTFLESVSAAGKENSLFYQTKNHQILHLNLTNRSKDVICTDENCVLISDASGIYWVNTEKAENYTVYNIPSSSPDAKMFIGHPSTIINWSGEEVNFSFDTLI